MELTSRLNALPFSDVDARRSLLGELFGDPNAEKSFVHPPFYCTSGIGTRLGERASIGQSCSFLDLGGITIGERTMISPKVTLITEGHPIEPVDRYAFITVAPIVIGARVWVGAAATILPGVTIGHDSARIHRSGSGDGWVVTPRCPSVAGESILSRDPFSATEGHLVDASFSYCHRGF
jgi:acetyltransferase-like isoleucine patch superfamily enzyme